MGKTVFKFVMVLITAGSAGFALGIGAMGAAIFSGLFCAIFSFLLFSTDIEFLKG